MPDPRSGYTLPVFACAAAIASLRYLYDPQPYPTITLDLINPPASADIPIEQVAGICAGMALAITRSDPGDNLDLTRHTPIWAVVEWADAAQQESVALKGGEGIGIDQNRGDQAAVYAYAQRLLKTNLERELKGCDRIQVTIILPEGRALAARTSNAAFGVVEGLSLLGTSGISQPLTAPGQLEAFQTQLQQKADNTDSLVFCLGENGLDIARTLGIPDHCLIKTANWLGPMLVAAGEQGLKSILLLGYHGKLIKLAGGIFHTHHHLADGRQEILTAIAANAGLPTSDLQVLFNAATAEAGLQHLRSLDQEGGNDWMRAIYTEITNRIDQRSRAYIQTHCGDTGGCDRNLQIGSALFDRSRTLFAISPTGHDLIQQLIKT
ncbi:MAG: cobalt-precorrin-5B (C(1))-methyltransferase CbiD [Thermosynechococcaceae cyanobacterium]